MYRLSAFFFARMASDLPMDFAGAPSANIVCPGGRQLADLRSLGAVSCLQEPCLQAEANMCTVACKVCKSREALILSSYTFTVQWRQARP